MKSKKMRIQLSILLLIALFFALPLPIKSQVTIGSLDAPQPFSLLEIATNKIKGGLRLPQLTSEERDTLALSSNAELAKGLLIYNTTIDCVEYWNGTQWISTCKGDEESINIPSQLGTGSLTGRTCFDVVMSNFTTDCGTEASRISQKADFTQDSINTQTYTFTKAATGTVQNVRYVIQDPEGVLLVTQPLSGTLVTGIMTSATATVTLHFKTDLNATLTGRTRADAAQVIINIIYNDGTEDVKAPLTLMLQDCACCGAVTITGPTTTGWLTFMCHNLGADQNLDPMTYVVGNADGSGGTLGWLFQWGRQADGHQLRNSATTTTLATTAPPGHSNFILTKPVWPSSWEDWISPSDPTLWGATKTANDPCPTGYRVPTQAEWASITNLTSNPPNTWTWTGNGYKVGNGLFLPAAGHRNRSDGSLSGVGSAGDYWSCMSSGGGPSSTYFLMFNSNYMDVYGMGIYNGDGLSVRCVAE